MQESADLTTQLDGLVDELDMAPPPGAARRRGAGDEGDDAPELQLVERDGVLHVEQGFAGATPAAPSGRRRGGGGPTGDVKWRKQLATLERAKIGDWLDKLDRKLTPNQGLRRMHDGALVPADGVPADGDILLLVHGTFSNSESFFDGWAANPAGEDWLRWAQDRYEAILTFDHPTLTVSPMLNARKLGLLFKGSEANVDVICHSRGGLVTRWWLDVFDQAPAERRRAVFVGSPLAGTGLAAPPNIKGSLSLLSNIGSALGAVTAAVPFLTVMTGVFRVITSVTKLAAKTPAVDAAVALIPGLVAQSRVGNNRELLSLRDSPSEVEGRYFAVRANFESEKAGWQFWKYFRNVGGRVLDTATDVVFDGQNDLVVDTGSMTEFSDSLHLPDGQVLDFGTTDHVHHTNYFAQPETVRFLIEKLGTVGG